MESKKIFKTFLLFLVVSTLNFNCGEPLGPASPGWELFATFPGYAIHVGAICAGYSGRVYAVVEDWEEEKNVILKYDGRLFTEEFNSPYEYGKAWFADIAALWGNVWAVGGKLINNTEVPYMVRYDYEKESWEEVSIAGRYEGTLSAVYPINDTSCWLLLKKNFIEGEREGVLAKYDNGNVKVFNSFGEVTATYYYEEKTGGGILYAVSNVGGNTSVYISDDGGYNWITEVMELRVPAGHKIAKAWAGNTLCSNLYLIAEFGYPDFMGIIKRSGTPGKGKYGLAFLAFTGPHFSDIKDIAFQDTRPRSGIAVGSASSVIFYDPDWYLEEFTYPDDLLRVARAPGHGFWGLGKNQIFEGRYDLFYHR